MTDDQTVELGRDSCGREAPPSLAPGAGAASSVLF